jgi:hypothetical protein
MSKKPESRPTMYGLKPISDQIGSVTGKTFQRKYIMLGRIVTQWSDIIGSKFADKAQPVKIRYIKPKVRKQKPSATLDIAVSPAHATMMHYQKDIILQRLNQIFGDNFITDIRFVPQNNEDTFQHAPSKPLRKRRLTQDDQQRLNDMVQGVEDEDIKERLLNLGKAMLEDPTRK